MTFKFSKNNLLTEINVLIKDKDKGVAKIFAKIQIYSFSIGFFHAWKLGSILPNTVNLYEILPKLPSFLSWGFL